MAHWCHRGRPPHLSKTRSRLPLEVHEAVFAWVLQRLAEHGLIKGERIGVDASTMEANAALRAIVRRDSGEGYREMLERLAAESGIATPTAEDLVRLDRKRKGKRLSNADWTSPIDPEARIAKLKDGRTRLAYKPEHAVDLDTGAIVAAEIQIDRMLRLVGQPRWPSFILAILASGSPGEAQSALAACLVGCDPAGSGRLPSMPLPVARRSSISR